MRIQKQRSKRLKGITTSGLRCLWKKNTRANGIVLPGITRALRYVVQKGTAATLDFAAVTAQASRVLTKYKKELPGLWDSCLQASKKAWRWAMLNPSMEYNQGKINETSKPVVS